MPIQQMSARECFTALAKAGFGRLGCVRENRPYVVPLYFVAKDHEIYAFSMSGQKIDWMRENPHVCLEVDTVENAGSWTSVIAFGLYRELPDTPEHQAEREMAQSLLQHRASWWEPGASPVEGRAEGHTPRTPVIFSVSVSRMTGHRKVEEREDHHGPV